MGLFTPGWMSDDYNKAEAALQRVTRQAVLYRAAREAPDARIRRSAVGRLNDASVLMELVGDTALEGVGIQAVNRLLEILPFAGVWRQICQTKGEAARNNAQAKACLACVARFGSVILRRKAAGYVTDQALLKWLYENDKDEEVRISALVRIEDQDYLQAVFDKTDSEELRLCLAVHMRDTANAAWLARTAKTPHTCIRALRKTGNAAIAAEVLEQTLFLAVCEACAEMVNIADITDDWRLAVLALCGPKDVRAQAADKIQDWSVLERIARRERAERFPVINERETLSPRAVEYAFARKALPAFQSAEALKGVALNPNMPGELRVAAVSRMTDERVLLELVKSANTQEVRKKALKYITDAKALFDIVSAKIPENFRPEICERLDTLDADWAQQLDDAAVRTLTGIIKDNRKAEKFDFRHYAAALKSVYRQGRAKAAIRGLQGKAVAHLDYTGRDYRDKWCHQDGGSVYFDLRDTVLAAAADQEEPKDIALEHTAPKAVRLKAARRTESEDALFLVGMETDASIADLKQITAEDKLLALVRGADSPKVRMWAAQQVTDADALLKILVSDVMRYCTPSICVRLDALDAGWARRLSDSVVAEMISIIADNKKDEQFDFRPVAAALKRVYAAGRFSGAIEGLKQKAISHVDSGKAYRDKWCHQDKGYTYFNLTNEV